MNAATLRLLFCLVLIGLLPVGAWACADMARPAQVAAMQPASAPTAAAAATDRPATDSAVALLVQPHPPAVCGSCQSCAQCHTPALTPDWRLALAPAEPLPMRQDALARFASAIPTPRLKPPIS